MNYKIPLFQIYNKPLEVLGTNDSFLDFCNCYDLNRGKQDSDEDEESSGVGEFKVRIVDVVC